MEQSERETIVRFAEGDKQISVYTYNVKLQNRLKEYEKKHPDLVRLIRADSTGAVTYLVDKRRLSFVFTEPQDPQRRAKASERMRRVNDRA